MPPYRLRTLGTLALQGPDGLVRGPAAQRKRLALLALLASAGERGLTREKLVGYLWPETTGERARHQLAQALHAMRRELDAPELFVGTDPVRLNAALVTCDARALEDAIARGDVEAAVALHAGPFLDGFHLAEAEELDAWVEGERARLRNLLRGALAAAAIAASARHDADAVTLWRELVALDALDAAATVGYMEALAAAGERVAALRHAQAYEVLVREQLGAPPSSAVRALVARLQRESGARPRPSVTPPALARMEGAAPSPARAASPSAVATPSPSPSASRSPATLPSPIAASSVGAPLPRAASRRRLVATAVVALAVVAALALVVRTRDRQVAVDDRSGDRVAVVPFTVRGGAAQEYMADGMVDLLSAALDGMDGLRTVDARTVLAARPASGTPTLDDEAALARRVRAGAFVHGTVSVTGARLRVDAAMHDARDPGRVLARSSVEGDTGQLFLLVDGTTALLVAGRRGGDASRLARLAAITSHSLPALRAHLEGERRFRAGQLGPAIEAFGQAVELDSTFALAWYRLALAASWYVQPELATMAARRAVALAGRLPVRERHLAQGLRSYVEGDGDAAEREYRAVLALHPDDLEAWSGLGEVLFHNNWPRGRSLVESRLPWQRVLALDHDDWTARFHLAQVAAFERRPREVDSLVRAMDGGDSLALIGVSPRLLRASLLADTAAERGQRAVLADAAHGWVLVAVRDLAVLARDRAAAARAARVLVRGDRTGDVRALGHVTLAALAAADGDAGAVRAALEAAAAVRPFAAMEHRAALLLRPGIATPAELRTLRAELRAWPAHLPAPDLQPGTWTTSHADIRPLLRHYLLGLAALRAGEAAAPHADSVAAWATDEAAVTALARDLAAELRAEGRLAAGADARAALALLGDGALAVPFERAWASPFWSRASSRALRARLLAATGRAPEAARAVAGLEENGVFDLPYARGAR